MDEKTMQQMGKMVDAVQPECDEQIIAAMTCSRAGSMSSALIASVGTGLISRLFGGGGAGKLPNPVFIAVGTESIYAFDYAPRGFKFKIKKQVARWPKDEVNVLVKKTGAMAAFDLSTASGESYSLEVATMMGARELVQMFLETLGGSLD